MLKQNKKNYILIALILVIMAVGGISAYFTAVDDATNVFTSGNVQIDLQEPKYDEVPEERQAITPNQELTKDPQVTNIGINDAFIFLRVSIPKANVMTAAQNGTVQPAILQELFLYTINSEWTQVEKKEGSSENTYVFAYGSASACTPLKANQTTPVLFKDSKITFLNAVEGQGLEEQEFEIPVEAFGIQTTDLNDKTDKQDKTAPADVWSILLNQVDSKNAI